ncbi:MAG: hypothetical protein M3525_07095 [Acidobacteriota bacterium]|nr:hypothetical protein [Acidobacteriota bacterium]
MENIKQNLFGLMLIRGKNNSRKKCAEDTEKIFSFVCFATCVHFCGYCFSIPAFSWLTLADVFIEI